MFLRLRVLRCFDIRLIFYTVLFTNESRQFLGTLEGPTNQARKPRHFDTNSLSYKLSAHLTLGNFGRAFILHEIKTHSL